jgi:predicted nucleic acid-binding protein
VIHLDTSFLVLALARGSPADRKLRTWLRGGEEIAMSAIGWAEFLCGPITPEAAALAGRLIGEPTAFGAGDATLAAHLFNETGRRRGSLADCMIAATAIQAGASLATANPRDFARFAHLRLEFAEAR